VAAIAIVLAAIALFFSLHHSGGHEYSHGGGCCCCGGGMNGGGSASGGNFGRFGTNPTTVVQGPTNFSPGSNYFTITRTAIGTPPNTVTNAIEIIFYSNVSGIQ